MKKGIAKGIVIGGVILLGVLFIGKLMPTSRIKNPFGYKPNTEKMLAIKNPFG